MTEANELIFFIDVTIVSPACHSYVLTLHSDDSDLVTANNAAKKNGIMNDRELYIYDWETH